MKLISSKVSLPFPRVSLRSSISHCRIFLYYSLSRLTPSGVALPLGATSVGNGTSTLDPDRSSTFSLLADGTQDLAALVGLFATDSVERYATDHTRGSWCAAMAPCSLLGILGWVRAMFKLAMGFRACENVGFPTGALRPLLGVSKKNSYPSDNVTEVHYTHRREQDKMVIWSTTKVVTHTHESMPLIEYVKIRLQNSSLQYEQSRKSLTITLAIPYTHKGNVKMYSGPTGYINLPILGEYYFRDSTLWKQVVQMSSSMPTKRSIAFLILLSVSTCVSTTVILPMTGDLTWTRLWASIGFGSSLWTGSVLWKLVYEGDVAKARHPNIFSDNDIKLAGPWRWAQAPRDFAFFRVDTGYVIFTPSPVRGVAMLIVRGVTALLAMSAVIGYLCQYLTLRTMTAAHSGIWLGVQAGLAMLRIITWIILEQRATAFSRNVKTCGLKRMPPIETERQVLQMSSPERSQVSGALRRSTEAELVLAWFDPRIRRWPAREANWTAMGMELLENESGPLKIPRWVVDFLGRLPLNLEEALKSYTRAKEGIRDESVLACLNSEVWWDMPENLFLNWLLLHNRHESLETLEQKCRGIKNRYDRKEGYGWGCRLILVRGELHLWPCVKDCSVRFRGYSERGFSAFVFSYTCLEREEAGKYDLFASQDDPSNCGYDPAEDYRSLGKHHEYSREHVATPRDQSKQMFFSPDLYDGLQLNPRYWEIDQMIAIQNTLEQMLLMLDNVEISTRGGDRFHSLGPTFLRQL